MLRIPAWPKAGLDLKPQESASQRGARAKILRANFLKTTALMPAAAFVGFSSSALAQAVNLGTSHGNAIIPDGRTATTLSVHGSVTNIRTSTFSGGNAYNSFSTFSEASGNTVNLIVPNNANALVNVVRNGAVNIQGALNSYKNGQIGGNVVFADSYGFVVGKSGSINVGSLTVLTPSQSVINGLIDGNGNVNNALAAQMLSGNVPLSPDGSVIIRGKINAQNFVKITAQDVRVAGSMAEAKRMALHRAEFEATVNAKGLVEGGAIVARNGSISIVAANNVTIGGTLSSTGGRSHAASVTIAAQNNLNVTSSAKITASNIPSKTSTQAASHKPDSDTSAAAPSTPPAAPSIDLSAGNNATIAGLLAVKAEDGGASGTINVTGNDINIASTAQFIAQGIGTQDGGTISLKAVDTTTVAAGASFIANALGSGNGGLVELSGKVDAIDPNIVINLGSATGNAGTLLFDPDDLYIGGVSQNQGSDNPVVGGASSTLASLYTNGANVELDAANSITINGVIDTREYAGDTVTATQFAGLLVSNNIASTGNSGSITLNAPTITINSGGALYADADNGKSAGTVTLTASATDNEVQNASSASTGITIAGTITGGVISVSATSTASTDFSNGALGFVQLPAGIVGSALLGINGGYVGSSATANVTVAGTANINGTGAVTLSSQGSETASDPVISIGSLLTGSLNQPFAAGVVVGKISGNVSTEVQSGATISSGGALNVLASNSATLSISAQTLTFNGASADATFAYSTGSAATSALIDTGAVISKAASLTVASQNTNSFSTESSANALGSAQVGVAVAINDATTSSTAKLGAGIASAAGVGNVTVYSGSNTTQNVVQASTTVGSNFLTQGIGQLVQTATAPISTFFGGTGPLASTTAGSAMSANGTSSIVPKGGVSLALNLDSQSSTAAIDATGSSTAPTINVSGSVAVISLLTDAGIRADASTTINSDSYTPSPSDPTASSALSLGVNVAQITHTSDAYIGSNVHVAALHVGIEADTTVPITNTWTDFSTFSQVTSHFTGDLGIVNDILTSYANATSESSSTGLAGAVNYFQITNNTTAWIASDAHVSETDTNAANPIAWSSTITIPNSTSTQTINWNAAAAVTASTVTQSINVGGNFSWLTLFGTNSSSTEGTAVGGSANVNIFNTTTIAGIGAGAVISAPGGLDVAANTADLVYGVAPTSGKGSGFGLNGIASVLMIDNTTWASISNEAEVTASNIQIAAEQNISSFSIGGAVGASKGAGVGIAVALADISTDTEGFIGDNSGALALSGATGDDKSLTATGGYTDAPTIAVSGLTVGRLTTISVAAQYNNNAPNPDAPAPIQATDPSSSGFLSAAAQFLPTKFAQISQKLSTLYNNLSNANQNMVNGTSSIAGAGSTSVDLSSIGTLAYISGASLNTQTGAVGNSVSVQALNNTIIDTASGAAAIAKGAPGTNYAVGIAGAVSLDISTDNTTAKITGSNIISDRVTVQALAGGENTVIGLAISATAGTSSTSVAVSVSGSVAMINDGVDALIDSSTLSGHTSNDSNILSIAADQETEIGIGAGSLYVKLGQGNGGGVGVAITYAEIGDPFGADAVSAILSNSSVQTYSTLSVLALDDSRILSGAAVAGGGTDSNGFAGAIVVNTISPSVVAEITGTPAVSGTAAVTGGITVSGDVTVVASGGSNSTLDALISNAALSANGGLAGGGVPADDSGYDFTGAALGPTSSTGAAILAVAGNVQYGANNVGVALVVNNIDQSHEALIDGVTLTSTGGVVQVSAADDADILGIAVGAGIATGSVAGLGSIVYNSISNAVIAQIGHGVTTTDPANTATATVEAAAVSVTAEDGSHIRGATGAISLNLSGGNAVGLATTINVISNYVSAGIGGANVTADETLSDASPLITGQLNTGSVLVSGQSTANILTIAIGTAITVGASQDETPPSPEQNFASFVSGLKPTTPSTLTGGGTGGASSFAPPAPSTPPPTPQSPPPDPATGLSGAGSIGVSLEATSVYSVIAEGGLSKGSTVSAQNNVIVSASNADSIASYSGALSVAVNAGSGIGLSLIVNQISGTTNAYIDHSSVDAYGTGAAVAVDNGVLSSTLNPSSSLTPATDPIFSDGTSNLNGIAVIATSDETVNTVAAVLSMSTDGASLSGNTITNTMSGTTQAYASNAQLDTNLVSGQTPGIQVTAASASFANNLDLGIADSANDTAGTVAIIVNKMNRTTNASILDTLIGTSSIAAGAVNVAANAWEGTSGESIGAAGSDGFGVSGSSLVNIFSATTSASFVGGASYAGSLSVAANTTDGYFGAVGTAAVGSDAGVGAGVLVAIINNSTNAVIGDTSGWPVTTSITLNGALSDSATTTTKVQSYDIAFAAGGDAGVAAMVSYNQLANNTTAEVANSFITIPSSVGTGGTVQVEATEKATIDPIAGGLAAGGSGGIGASANVVILQSSDTAEILSSTVSTPGAVTVSSNSQRDIEPIDATGGLGGDLGLAATVGVVLVGTAASSSTTDLLNEGGTGSLASASTATGQSLTSSLGGGNPCLTGGSSDCISASIQGGTVTAGNVTISATGDTKILNVVGALGVGGTAGFGAAVGFTQLDQTIAASATGGSITAPSISITAVAGDEGSSSYAAETMAVAGAGGAYFGLGAAVADTTVSNTVTAELSSHADGGTGGSTSGILNVSAGDTSAVVSDGYGFAGGLGAIGGSVALAQKSSTIDANFQSSTSVTNMANVAITASASGSVTSYTIAGAAGAISGAGAGSTSKDSDQVTADIGSGSSVSASGDGVLVYANATPDLSSSAIGVAVGASVGLGASVAESDVTATVKAYVDDSTTISGGALTISAVATPPTSGNAAYATADAGGGGLLIGIQATYAEASDNSTVTAYGGNNLHLPAGDVTIAAENDSSQSASTTGVAAGYVGAGASVAQASSDAMTTAYLNPGAVTASSNTGVLAITATGNDSNTANATAGSGGVVAGSAAVATTSTTDTTTATLYGNNSTNTLYLGGLDITAGHTTTYSATGNAFQASVVGASGGSATNTVTSTVTAEVGTNLIINSAGGDMDVSSSDGITQTSGGAQAGSGGIAAGAATISTTHVTQTVTTNIDAGTILSLNDDPSTSTAKIDIEAFNSLTTTDSVSLIAGGLFAGGGAESDMTANATDKVNIGNNVELFSAGLIDIGTASQMMSNNNANANLYGAVTGAGATTNSTLNATQQVILGTSDEILGWGIVSIYAGESGDGQKYSLVSANATTTVYNEAIIPITATYSGAATATDNSTLTIGTGSEVLAVNNLFVSATKGTVLAAGNGTNYNPYLSLFSTDQHSTNSNPSGNGAIVLDGLLSAGIHDQALITIAYGGAITLVQGGPAYGLYLENVADVSDLNPIMSYNHQSIQYTIVPGFNPYTQILNELVSLSGLTSAQVQTALASQTLITPANDDAAGDNQRQINTLVQQIAFATNASGNSLALGNILVSAGNVTIQTDTLTQSSGSSIKALDSAKIDIENHDVTFLDLSKLTITGVSGGHVNFTGAVTSANNITEDLTGLTPSIKVNADYAGQLNNLGDTLVVTSTGTVLSTKPDIYFDDDVVNVNGIINVNDQLGSVVIASLNFDGATIQMTVPNGNLTYNGGAGSIYSTNHDVASQFYGDEYRPTNAITAVDAAATYIEQTFLNYYYNGDNGYYVYAPVSSSGYSDPNAVFTARLLAKNYDGYPSQGNPTLISDIFLPAGGSGGGENVGWERGNFEGQAYAAGDSGPFNCHNCGTYFTEIQIQTLNYTAATGSGVSGASAPSPVMVGGAIILSASYLNINGTLESGHSSTYSASIGSAAATQIANIKNNPLTLAADQGKLISLTTTPVNGTDTTVNAAYDVSNDQIILQNVVQGAGGYIYLNGKIISTSTSGSSQGNLIVNGGYGTVNIQNTTGTKLVTNTINTGASSNNVIEIVDQNLQSTKWYVYNAASNNVTIYTQSGVNNTNFLLAPSYYTVSNSNLSYMPMANQLYEWIDTATLTRSVSVTNSFNDAQTTNPWTFNYVNSAEYPYTETTSVTTGSQSTNYAETVTATGSYVTSSFNTGDKDGGTDFEGQWTQNLYNSVTLTLTNTVQASHSINITFNAGTSSSVTVNSNASVVIQGSITNQNGSTSILATGTGSAITEGVAGFISGQSVTLSAPGGIGTQAKPVSIQTFNGTLTADATDNDIAIKASGALSISHVIVSPTVNGQDPQGNVYLSTTGDITSASAFNVNTPIIVGKSIEIDTTGGAVGATSSASTNGTVLSNINPIVIEAQGTLLGNGTVDGGILNSNAANGAYIIQSTGNLLIGSIQSSGGPVFLEAAGAGANILNGVSAGGLTAAQTTYLQNVWTSLSLQSGAGTIAVNSYQSLIDNAYADYWQLRNLAFADGSTYAITAQGSTVIATQLAASEGVLVSSIGATQIQTEATNRFMRDEYLLGIKTLSQLGVASVDALFGISVDTSHFQAAPGLTLTPQSTYNSSFSYILPTSSSLYSEMTSQSTWSLDQLTYAISASANAATTTAPPPLSGTSVPNISAQSVMLYAPNGSIGSLAAPATFTFTSADDSSLTAADKALLTTAGPGQLQVTTTSLGGGVTQYNVSVAQQSLLIVSPQGPVAAQAKTSVYLGSASNLNLGGIPTATFGPVPGAVSQGVETTGTGGTVRLEAVDSILGLPNEIAISGSIASLTLIADNGSLGAAGSAGTNPAANPNALLLALSGTSTGQLDVASAAQGIYLRQTTGDLILGNITDGGSGANGAVQLSASGSIYAEPQFTDRTAPHIIAASLDLRAGNAVSFNGATYQPLQIEVSGAVTGTSTGNMTILDVVGDLTIGQAGQTYGTLTSGGALVVNASVGNLNVNNTITGASGLELLASQAITLGAGTSGTPLVASSTNGALNLISGTLSMGAYSSLDASGAISVSTTGNATLGQLDSTMTASTASTSTPVISVTAGGVATTGAILSNGDGRENVVASGTNGTIVLTASGDIGSSAHALAVDDSLLSVTSSGGNIYLSSINALHISMGKATTGSLTITGNALLTLDALTAGTTLNVTSTGEAIALGSANSGGTQTIEAYKALSYTTLKTSGAGADAGDIKLTSDTSSITGNASSDTLEANGSFTLNAATTITGTSLKADNGSGFATTAGLITFGTVNTGTTLGVTSTAATITLGSATSGSTQTIEAKTALNYTTLKTTAGDIDLTSDTASITGHATSDTLEAKGAFDLVAATTISGTSLTSDTGSGTVHAGSDINLGTVNTGTTLGVTSTAATITLGSATSGSTQTIEAKTALNYTTLKTTAGDIDLTSDTASITGHATSDTLEAKGAFDLVAATTISGTSLTSDTGSGTVHAGSDINLGTVNTGTTLGVTSTAATITLGSATSGSTQTIEAKTALNYTTLKTTAGDIDLTSDTASITGHATSDTLEAKGAFDLVAATTISGTSLTSDTGSGTVHAGSDINLGTVNTGTTLGVTSTAATITLGSATSGSTQTIEAKTALNYTTLKTTAGDIDLTSDTASITGHATSDTLEAKGAFDLVAATTISGTSLTSDTGSGTVHAGSDINLGTVNTGTTLGVTSTAATITLGSATSGSTQTIEAKTALNYTTLKTTAGDIDLTSDTASITGHATSDTLEAKGAFDLVAATTISGTSLTSDTGSGTVHAGSDINLGTVNTGTTLGVTSTAATITLGSATSGSTQTIEAKTALNYTTLKTTAGDIDLTSDTASITGHATSDTLEAKGAFDLVAATTISGTSLTSDTGSGTVHAGSDINLGTVNTGTTLGVTSTAATITLGSATSGSTQTFGSMGNIAFEVLTSTGGDIDATSTTASINGTTVTAHGSADLSSYLNNTGTSLTAQTGGATLVATTGDITWQTISAATAFGATASAGKIALGSATSGGTQSIDAHKTLTYTTLKTNGTSTDAGDINLTSDTLSITGNPSSDTLDADGSFNLNAVTAVSGTSLKAETGRGSINTAGAITLGMAAVAKSLSLTSTSSTIVLGSASSGGTQNINAAGNIQFSLLQTLGIPGDGGDVNINTNGSLNGGSIYANGFVSTNSNGLSFDQINAEAGISLLSSSYINGNGFQTSGQVTVSAAGDLSLGTISAGSIGLSSPTNITINTMTLGTSANFATQDLNVNLLRQNSSASGPLSLTITGYNGSIGDNANFGFIDAPNGLNIPLLREDPVNITTSAGQINIADALLIGTMRLRTPTQNLWFNNVSSQPINGYDVQFFQPGQQFYFIQNGNITTTNSYVVQFDSTAIINESVNGVFVHGSSFIRDINRQTYMGNDESEFAFPGSDTKQLWSFPVEEFDQHLRALDPRSLSGDSQSSFVNLGDIDQNETSLSPAFQIVFKRKRH